MGYSTIYDVVHEQQQEIEELKKINEELRVENQAMKETLKNIADNFSTLMNSYDIEVGDKSLDEFLERE